MATEFDKLNVKASPDAGDHLVRSRLRHGHAKPQRLCVFGPTKCWIEGKLAKTTGRRIEGLNAPTTCHRAIRTMRPNVQTPTKEKWTQLPKWPHLFEACSIVDCRRDSTQLTDQLHTRRMELHCCVGVTGAQFLAANNMYTKSELSEDVHTGFKHFSRWRGGLAAKGQRRGRHLNILSST